MIKKIVIGVLVLIIGFVCALYADSFLRFKIQDVYQFATSNKIELIGKNLFFFISDFYCLGFGAAFLTIYLANYRNKLSVILKNGFIAVLFFIISLITISIIDAHLKLIECTACDNGIRQLSRNEINYLFIILSSLLISIIPSIFQVARSKRVIKQVLAPFQTKEKDF